MAERVKYEVRRFFAGYNNSTSAFGTVAGLPSEAGGKGGPITQFPNPGDRFGQGGPGVHGSVDSFTTDASDASGTGVWIQPTSGGVLEAYPRTGTTDTLMVLTDVTAAAYAKHSDGTERMIMYGGGAGNDEILELTTAGAEGVSSLKTMTSGAGKRASITVYQDQFLVANGVDNPVSVDISSLAITDPITEDRPDVSTGATLSAGDVAGNVKGTVHYYIAEVIGSGDTLSEGALSAAHANLTIDAGINQEGQGDQITITLDDSEFYGNTYRIYRTYADQSAPNYLAEIVVAGSTPGSSFVDNIPDVDLGNPPRLHGDPPPSGITAWTVHKGRMFGLAGNKLYFSDADSYKSWFTSADGNWINVAAEDGDTGTALARTSEGLVVFKANHIYLLLGDGEDSFRLSDALSTVEGHSVGTPHTQSVVAVPGGLIFYWRNGIYGLFRGQIVKLSGQVESQWIDPTVVYPEDDAVSLGYDPRFGHVYVGYNYATASTPESCFIFDLQTNQWIGASQDAGAKTYLYDPGAAARAPVFYALSANGLDKVRKLVYDKFSSTQNTTEGSRWTPSGAFAGADPNTLKRWLYLDFVFVDGSSGDTVTITPNVDGTDATGVSVTLPTTPGRKRVNVRQLGYRMTFEFVAAAAQKPWGLLEVVAAYQEVKGASA